MPLVGALSQVVHGCLQPVPCGVVLSPATSATTVQCCQHLVGDTREIAVIKPKDGRDDVKTSCHLCLGVKTCYNRRNKGLRTCEGKQIPQIRSQFRLESETRLDEVGIASNRGSAFRGEYVPGRSTHSPSHQESLLYQKSLG